ncbi:hypothetical protein MATR_03390 [Marivirga tractuosa]|uniref:Uncharacterized protein n=1 Tax=Marivirga tractuosa (strain ATCC 23168 / DSM 4126 / NBRC 15989 / NCIMB 1408 / VKM B-1430 / H-43) TaxID=643867 RepID=E4TTX2_MARTH|nr:hypothetical protein [Marivirga tractuosa]ADR22027.1 hypothetical protein Ftrac_2042 [Marivirga tractuosa DSM 4126]BDD13514.1 hypothetical protein MATR_03390 [Marivirga tractuosa]
MSNQEKLLERSKKYEQDLSEQLKEYSGKAEKFGKNALMIAGGVFLAYQAVKLITGGSKKNKKSQVYKEVNEDENEYDDSPRIIIRREESSGGGIMDALKAEVGGILVAIAREKILEFLSQLENHKSNDREEEA